MNDEADAMLDERPIRRRNLEALLDLVEPEDPVLDELTSVIERSLVARSHRAELQEHAREARQQARPSAVPASAL
jgi:hypothetical protein